MKLDGHALRLSPSDLNNYLACERRTALDHARARGEITLHKAPRPDAELIAEKGLLHEQDFLDGLRESGSEVVAITSDTGSRRAAEQTVEAMRRGADIIHQAAFVDDGWRGYADFLIRRDDAESDLGSWSYEAYDAKLAAHPKPYFILQLLFYSDGVARVQGRAPEHMHLVLGTNEVRAYRPADFSAYAARVRGRFSRYLDALGGAEHAPYPYPVEHCDYCDWWAHCRDKRRADDHLSLVAFLTRGQAIKLEKAGIATVANLAAARDDTPVERLSRSTARGLRQQARLQVERRETGLPVRKFRDPEAGRGFALLPEPSAGDVFFDIEGDPYWGEGGLEYLLGTVTSDGGPAASSYHALWAHDRDEERRAFEAWVDTTTAHLREHPDMHVYHYNHYEPTALKKLMTRYGTREREVDELLRRKVFVDLYVVVRQSMWIGEEGYSLKDVEVFYPLDRDAEVTEAGGSILAYQEYLESRDPARLGAIADYNADDCRSTLALRDWLLAERQEAERTLGVDIASLAAKPETEPTEAKRAALAELERLREALAGGLDEDVGGLDAEQRARRLLAHLLEYHRREQRPQWWAYFDRLVKTPAELCDEDTEALGNLELAADIPLGEEKRSWLYPLRFDAQEHKLGPGRAVDPVTEATVTLARVDDVSNVAWLKRGKQSHAKPLPRALIPGGPIEQTEQEQALRRLAERICESGLDPIGELDAACDLLMRRPPRVAGLSPGAQLHAGEPGLDALKSLVTGLDRSALFVQGPPGSGKTWTGARLIVDLIGRERRVGIAATGHKAIHNLLEAVEDAAAEAGVDFQGLKKASSDAPDSWFESAHVSSSSDNGDFPPPADVLIVAGTPWLWARTNMNEKVDVLFVDEAGQVALADAVAMSQGARSVVLLGDPQQLAHVSQGSHPDGSEATVLAHLLGEQATVSPEQGVFLEHTWRMHPDVTRFVSEAMYDGRLRSVEGLERQRIESPGLAGAGVHLIEIEHEENRQRAPVEAVRIGEEVERLLSGRFVDAAGFARDLTLDDILVVAPYNAQVRCLRDHLPDEARVGTVDKFQGQQAPVVFFSMTSSSGEDVPRGMDFLFSRNRLNVAVSRAQCLSVVVCSPSLLSARCNTIEQMRLVNALCQFADEAERQARRA